MTLRPRLFPSPMTVLRTGNHSHLSVIFVVAILLLAGPGCDSVGVGRLYEHGAVVSASAIASDVGGQIFLKGGNAFDVAVAVGFTLAVVYPRAGNIGGGGFAVIRDAEKEQIRTLDFREIAPGSTTEQMYLDDNGEVVDNLSTFGARACAVPGSVAGLHELWKVYGSLPWLELVTPAASLADTGFTVDQRLAEGIENYREELASFPETAEIFLPGGEPPRIGDRFIQTDLSATLKRIADEGSSGFYQGKVAALVDSCMRRHSGLITESDLAAYRPVWRDALHFVFDSLDIYSMPPPSSGGVTLGQMLKLLESFDLSQFMPESPEYIHLLCEASRLAFADRSEHLGDPDYYKVPDYLLDDYYLAVRRKKIIERRAGSSLDVQPGSLPDRESDQTTHFSVCDQHGNMVAITTTINNNYGSKLVVAGAGFLMNSEMDDFSIKPGQPNFWGLTGGDANKIEPGKRMLSSMAPTLVLKQGKPFLITGSPGGAKIITAVAQGILNFTRFRLSLAESVRQPRCHHQWLPDRIYLEEGQFDVAVKQALIRYGHDIEERSAIGNLQMIAIDDSGLMQTASDARHGGSGSGY